MWDGRHMHHNKAIKPFKPLSHRPPTLHQIHHQTWRAYMAVRCLLYCFCLSDVVRQWISLHTHSSKLTSERPLMKAPYVICNWIFAPASCLLRSKAFVGADYHQKKDTQIVCFSWKAPCHISPICLIPAAVAMKRRPSAGISRWESSGKKLSVCLITSRVQEFLPKAVGQVISMVWSLTGLRMISFNSCSQIK